MKASCNLSTPYTLQPSYAPSVSSAPPSRPGSAPVLAGGWRPAALERVRPCPAHRAPRRSVVPRAGLGMPTALAKQTCAPHRASLALESTADAWSELLTTWHCFSLPSPTLVLHRQHRRNGQRWRVDSPAYFFIFSSSFCSFASLSLPGAGPPPEPVKGLARGYAVFSSAQAGSELGKCKPDDAERTRDRQRKRGVPTAAPALSLPPARR